MSWTWLTDFLNAAFAWIKDVALYVPKWVVQHVTEALSALIAAIPVPDWLSGASGALGNIPASVVWFLDLLHFQFGLSVVLSAYVLRWVLRRIPFIG